VEKKLLAALNGSTAPPRPLTSLICAIFPRVSITISSTTSPWVPGGSEERSGFGSGENWSSAIWMSPSPKALVCEGSFCGDAAWFAGRGCNFAASTGACRREGCGFGFGLLTLRAVFAGAPPGV
jgi:hypothetical protein